MCTPVHSPQSLYPVCFPVFCGLVPSAKTLQAGVGELGSGCREPVGAELSSWVPVCCKLLLEYTVTERVGIFARADGQGR